MSMLLLLALACNGGKGSLADCEDVQVQLSEVMPTVATVTFRTSTEATARIAVEAGGLSFETRSTPSSEDHQLVLRGLKPESEVSFQILTESEGGSSECEAQTLTTGYLDGGLPTTLVSGEGNDQWMMVPLIGAFTGPVLLSPDGVITWAWPEERPLDVYRARHLRDGSGVIYNAASVSGDPSADSELVKVSWDGTQVETIPVPLLAHDFVELVDGTLTAIVVEYRPGSDGVDIRGDKLVEIAPDGTQTTVWSAWDCFDPEITPGDEPALGWTFVNALNVADDESAYYISIRNFSSIVKIDRASGACEWAVGGEAGTFEIDGVSFKHEHQFKVFDDRLLVFDNAGLANNKSRVVEYQLDVAAQTATEVWRFEPDPPLNSFVLGDVDRLDDGDTLVTWSVAGQIDRVSPDLTRSFSLNTELGYAFGFMTARTSLYGE